MRTFARPALALLATLLLACPIAASANIGDDLTQLRNRYGSAKDMDYAMLFQHEGYSICVNFDGTKSGMETFVRDGSVADKTDITDKDIQEILTAESGGIPWNEMASKTGKRTWVSTDGKLIARLATGDKPSDKFLTVMLNAK